MLGVIVGEQSVSAHSLSFRLRILTTGLCIACARPSIHRKLNLIFPAGFVLWLSRIRPFNVVDFFVVPPCPRRQLSTLKGAAAADASYQINFAGGGSLKSPKVSSSGALAWPGYSGSNNYRLEFLFFRDSFVRMFMHNVCCS